MYTYIHICIGINQSMKFNAKMYAIYSYSIQSTRLSKLCVLSFVTKSFDGSI